MGRDGTRRVMDAAHMTVDYKSLSKKDHNSLVAQQREAVVEEARTMQVNDGLDSIDATFLPSVHRMVTNAYSIIDVELRRLGNTAGRVGGLDKVATGQFERYASALVKLVNLDRQIKDGSEVEAMSDEELTNRVIEKLKAGTNANPTD